MNITKTLLHRLPLTTIFLITYFMCGSFNKNICHAIFSSNFCVLLVFCCLNYYNLLNSNRKRGKMNFIKSRERSMNLQPAGNRLYRVGQRIHTFIYHVQQFYGISEKKILSLLSSTKKTL